MKMSYTKKPPSAFNKFVPKKGPVKASKHVKPRPKTGGVKTHNKQDSIGYSSIMKYNNFFKENKKLYINGNHEKLLSKFNKGLMSANLSFVSNSTHNSNKQGGKKPKAKKQKDSNKSINEPNSKE